MYSVVLAPSPGTPPPLFHTVTHEIIGIIEFRRIILSGHRFSTRSIEKHSTRAINKYRARDKRGKKIIYLSFIVKLLRYKIFK